MTVSRGFFNWAKERDRQELKGALADDPMLLCRALVKIFGPCPEQGIKSRPGQSLKSLCGTSPHMDIAVIRQLVGKGFMRPTEKGIRLDQYEDQVYLLTRKGLNEILNNSADVMSDDVLSLLGLTTSPLTSTA